MKRGRSLATWIAAVAASVALGPHALAQDAMSGPVRESTDTKTSFAKKTGRTIEGAPLYEQEILSEVYTMDRIYKSMMGPKSSFKFKLDWTPEPGVPQELLWVTGYEAFAVDADGVSNETLEFTCHANLDVNPEVYGKRFPSQLQIKGSRLFTLAQGQRSVDLPHGFGVPMMSHQTLRLVTQVLNHNREGEEIQVRERVRVRFVRDHDLEKPLKALVPTGIQAMVLLQGSDAYFGLGEDEIDPRIHGEGCSIGDHAGESHELSADKGGTFSGFWYVPPGKHEYHSLVTKMLGLPYDTTVHYIAAHLHPFGTSLELRDLTTSETVYKTKTRQAADGKIGLAEIEYFSSQAGIALKKGHEYGMIATYDNTSGVRQDSMAVMILFLRVTDLYDFDFRPKGVWTPERAGAGS